MKNNKGSTVLTTPIIICMGVIFISILIVTMVKIIIPYIWYEKLSSTCIKYVFVIEEYGYLTKKEYSLLLKELEKQGFDLENIDVEYTSKLVDYGDEIFLKINYDYEFELPIRWKAKYTNANRKVFYL